MTRILIDATHTANTPFCTGIQRVVRRVAECSQMLHDRLTIQCVPIQCYRGRVFAVPHVAGSLNWDEQLAAYLRDGAGSASKALLSGVSALSPTAGRKVHHVATRFRKALYPRSLARAAKMGVARLRGREIRLRDDDIVLMLDATWNSRPVLYELAERHGCFVAQVVYDLLPITHSQFFSEDIVTNFSRWIACAFERVDCFWAISQTVRNELYGMMQQDYPERTSLAAEHFRSFHLGADLTSPGPNLRPRPSIHSIFTDAVPAFFSVGTIEPRKNHLWLLSAFDQFWSEGGKANLVLAGRVGWACDDIVNRIEQHPRYGSRLFWFKDASDDEVQYMYRHARATAYSSLAEGFGLPIVESLHQGTEVLASDTPIHREVGRDRVRFFSLDLLDDLIRQIHQLANSAKPADLTIDSLIPTWLDCTEALLSDVLRASPPAEVAIVGQPDNA